MNQSPAEPMYKTDAHSAHVARTAAELFRVLHPLHLLGAREFAVLRAAAELHDIGLAEGQEFHHISSRRLMLGRDLPGLSDHERLMAALVAGYHRKRVRWQEDEDLARLDADSREAALRLAGMLRIADGLDYSHEQAASVVAARVRPKRVRLLVKHTGQFPDMDIARANKKADLWNACAIKPIRVQAAGKDKKRKRSPLVCAQDPVPEAGRKIMLFHFGEMAGHEAGTSLGEDIEELHDMRVATRRLRAAFRLFRKPMGSEALEPFLDDLKWLGRALGEVRDLDVGIAYMGQRQQDAHGEEAEAVAAVIERQRQERESARERMLACLDGERYGSFKNRFGEFVAAPWLFVACPGYGKRVEKFAPRVILKRLDKVLGYGPAAARASEQELHALRIDCKRLRYTAEFFRSCYAASLQTWIDQVVEVQDVLGEIHDRDVRVPSLQTFLSQDGGSIAAGMRRIIEFEQLQRRRNLAEFRERWPRMLSKRFRQQLNKGLAKLR